MRPDLRSAYTQSTLTRTQTNTVQSYNKPTHLHPPSLCVSALWEIYLLHSVCIYYIMASARRAHQNFCEKLKQSSQDFKVLWKFNLWTNHLYPDMQFIFASECCRFHSGSFKFYTTDNACDTRLLDSRLQLKQYRRSSRPRLFPRNTIQILRNTKQCDAKGLFSTE